ncbi:MAG: protein translocase subunit SecF [Clostridia bacterium]|nr:protein translocase subunit SecF [Clostridia bacterium]
MKDKMLDFYGKRKIFFGISIGIIVIGIICNIIFGVSLDIQFSGGSMISYSYNGSADENEMKSIIQEKTPDDKVTFTVAKSIASNNADGDGYTLTVQFSGTDTVDTQVQSDILQSLQEKFPDNNFETSEFTSVDATMGLKFFVKCIVAVAIACALMVVYVTIRFKRIGGVSAGMFGLVALFHDMVMVYVVFVIFRMPIDSNFIAVILMILGYSLNDTIVMYDRIRENKAKMGPKASIIDVYNLSMTQCIKRTVMTSITTLAAITSVYVVCIVYNITSIQSFALPMIIGLISGCYSSICIATPLWVIWQLRKKNKEAAK